MLNLEQKNIYITGGSSGIGLATTQLLCELGANVIVADIVNAEQTVAPFGARWLSCDVSDELSVANSLEQARETFNNNIDGVILNAGVGDVGFDFEDTKQGLLDKITKINQWGVLYGLKHAPPLMNEGGSIAITSSMASHVSVPGCGVYSAAKRALNSMAATSALELGPRGIRVNAVCPGYVDTALGDTPEERRFSEYFTALGRHADPLRDVAPVFAFLMSSASNYITGQNLKVDGGMDLGPSKKLLALATGTTNSPGKA